MSEENIAPLVPIVHLNVKGDVVVIELHCSDNLAARVLFDDIADKITSGKGMKLSLRGALAEGSVA